MIRWAKSTESMNYMNKGSYYEITKIDSDGDIHIIGTDNHKTWYNVTRFDRVREFEAYEGYVKCLENKEGLNVGNLYKIQNCRISRTAGLILEVKNDDGDYTEYIYKTFEPMKAMWFKIGDSVVAYRTNKLGSNEKVKLEEFKEYKVLDVRPGEVKVLCEDGSNRWYAECRFETKETFEREVSEVNKRVDEMWDRLPQNVKNQTTTNKIENNGGNKMTITATKTNSVVNRLTERFGTFGAVDGVAITFTGKLAFLGMDGNYYSYEDNTLVANDDLVLEGMPAFAMPVLKSTLKAGDLIIQKDGTYAFVNKSGNYVNFKGEITPIAQTKHAMFGNALEYVSKVIDMGMGDMFGGTTADSANPFSNPMFMFMAMSNKDGATSGGKDMMSNFMMMQMFSQMGNMQNQDNPMMAMMPMMAFMDKGAGNTNEMMKMVFLSQMMKNQQNVK